MNPRALAALLLLAGAALIVLLLPTAVGMGEYLTAGTDKFYALLPVVGALAMLAWAALLVSRGERKKLFRLFLIALPLVSVLRRRLVFKVAGMDLTLEIVFAVALLVYMVWSTRRRSEPTGWLGYFLLLALGTGFSSAALAGVANLSTAWGILLETALPMTMFWIALRAVNTRDDVERTVSALLKSMLLFSALSLIWVFVLDANTELDATEVLTAQSRISGGYRRLLVGAGFVSANVGNRAFILLLPVAIAAIGGRILSRRNALHLFSILTAVYFIVATEHRAALLGAMVVFVAFFFFGQSTRIRPWLKILIAAVAVLALQGPILDYLGRRVLLEDGLLMDGSARKRIVMWKFAWELFRGHPLLGIGPFQYLSSSMHTRAQAITAHNYYVTILAEQGLLGLFAYLAMVGAVLARGLRNARRLADRELKRLNFGLLLGVFTYQVALVFAGGRLSHNGVIYIHGLYWTAAALLWALPGVERREPAADQSAENRPSSRERKRLA